MPHIFRWGIKPNVVELRYIVRHSREGGNLFIFIFKYIKWIPAEVYPVLDTGRG